MATVALVFLGAGVYVLAGWWLSGRFGQEKLEPEASADAALEPARLSSNHDGAVEFDTAVRGYRMDEVDTVIAQMQQRMNEQAAEIAALRTAMGAAEVASAGEGASDLENAASDSSTVGSPSNQAATQAAQAVEIAGTVAHVHDSASATSAAMPHTSHMAAPVTIELRIAMPASAQAVWDAITDWPSQGTWMLGTRVWVGAGDGRSVGSRIEAFTGVGKLGFLDTMNITVWDPPHRCEVLHTGRVVRGVGWMATEASATGSDTCVFVWGERLHLPWGWFGRLGWLIAGPLMKAGVRASLVRFQRVLSAGGR